jgi:hypothetical protein
LPTGTVFSKGAGTVLGATGRGIERGVFNDIVKYVKKDIGKMGKEGVEAAAAGKVRGGGRFQKLELKTTPEDIATANVVSDVVNPQGNPYRNIDKIQEKIAKRGYEIDNVVLNKDANSIHIGMGDNDPLVPYFNKAKSQNDVVFGKDPTIQNSYDSVIDLFQQERAKQPNNLSGIYKARQNMDRILREKFGPEVLEKDAKDVARKTAMQDIHEQVANFISDTLPEGNRFKNLLKDEALMYRAKRNISFNNPPTVSKTLMGKISHFAHEHPFAITAALGGTGFATGLITSPAVMGAIAAYGAYKVGKTVITNKMIRTELAKVLKGAGTVLNGGEKAEIRNVIKLMDDSERNIRGRKAIGPGKPESGASGGPTIPLNERATVRGTETGRMGSPYSTEPPLIPQPALRNWNPYPVTEGIGIPSPAPISHADLLRSKWAERVVSPRSESMPRSRGLYNYQPSRTIDITPGEQKTVKPGRKKKKSLYDYR